MRSLVSILVVLAAATVAAAQGRGVLWAIAVPDTPHIGKSDFETDWEHLPAVTFDPASGIVVSGQFDGPGDLTVAVRAVYDFQGLILHVRTIDDVAHDDDRLLLDVGPVSVWITGDGDTNDIGEIWGGVATRTSGGWSFRIHLPPPVTASLVGRDWPFNVGFEDHDDDGGTPQGTLRWQPDGSGVLHRAEPRTDLLDAAAALDDLVAAFGPDGVVERQAERLRAAADDSLWFRSTEPRGHKVAARILKKVRKAVRKLGRHNPWDVVTVRPLFAEVFDHAERASRVIALLHVRRAITDNSPDEAAGVLARYERAGESSVDLWKRIKRYRKTVKKAAKLFVYRDR